MLWDFPDAKTCRVICKRGGYLLAFSSDNKALACLHGAAKQLTIYDIPSGTVRHNLGGQISASSICFSQNAKYLAACNLPDSTFEPGNVVVWDVETGKVAGVIADKCDNIDRRGVVFLDDNRSVIVSSDGLRIYQFSTGRLVRDCFKTSLARLGQVSCNGWAREANHVMDDQTRSDR